MNCLLGHLETVMSQCFTALMIF